MERSEGRVFPVEGVGWFAIVYDGLDADSGGLDMAQLAKSLEGYARILAVASNFAISQEDASHADALKVRVRVTAIRPGSLTIQAVLDFVGQTKMIDGTGGAVVGAVLTYILSRIGRRKTEEEMKHLADIANRALEQNGQVNEKLIELADKLADKLAPAARSAVSPVGQGCRTVSVDLAGERLSEWDESDREAITEKAPALVQPQQWYTMYISELDVQTGSAKVSFSEDDIERIRAKIVDPVVSAPGSSYGVALANHVAIEVQAKASIQDGRISLLTISDARIPSSS